MKVSLPCGHCDGTGRKEAPELTRTLAMVHPSQWRTTQFLARVLLVGETNMCNRLAALRKLGMVERRGSGSRHSPYEWRRKS